MNIAVTSEPASLFMLEKIAENLGSAYVSRNLKKDV